MGGDTLPSPPTPGTPGTPGTGLTGGVAGAGLTAGPSPTMDPGGTFPITMLFFLPALSTSMLVSLTYIVAQARRLRWVESRESAKVKSVLKGGSIIRNDGKALRKLQVGREASRLVASVCNTLACFACLGLSLGVRRSDCASTPAHA